MSADETRVPDVRCVDFIDVVTPYLDGELPDELRARVEAHLDGCVGCRNVLAQWRMVIHLTGRLSAAEIEGTDPLIRDRLQWTFRSLRRR